MKHIVRLSVLSALLVGVSLPAYCAPSDADMGFATSREPTAADAGYGQVENVRGYQTDSGAGGPYAGADNGDQSHYAQENTDKTWFDRSKRDTSAYLINLPYDQSSQRQSQTKQGRYQELTNGIKTGTGLMATGSTSSLRFTGPQSLGFKGTGALTPYAMMHRYFGLPATGTGSVKLSTTSANGKD